MTNTFVVAVSEMAFLERSQRVGVARAIRIREGGPYNAFAPFDGQPPS